MAILRQTAEAAERMNFDFADLYRALPPGGEAIALDVVARRLGVDLNDLAQRDVLVFGLSRHRDVLRLRPDVRGMRMFARRLGRPK